MISQLSIKYIDYVPKLRIPDINQHLVKTFVPAIKNYISTNHKNPLGKNGLEGTALNKVFGSVS